MRTPTPPGTPLILSGAITPAALGMLCVQLHDLLADGGGRPVICDVSRLAVDLGAVDALGRLQLAAHRLGGAIALRGASSDLADLLEVCGLARAIGQLGPAGGRLATGSSVGGGRESVWEAEQREQTTDVEERVEPGDLPA